ncbi:hypothetical protein CC85DRAFT_138693 [Cutaneotrichosporon oleaginosum]|uniref:Origin recognition complex subunit 5 C-terminal domain-containing protein n=1 Tax=Cutaneotrichosporon oleaginosum TaxID=879819 RepID=A0A0J0XIM9_9TREE|nr:uncharacterized protein CC85DRAFT_138693 [Cutaneotrichosporon oleaginosum]KLT40945.1 hypothetical protein CC85DRAFT_138693 [Cutaneotrichosporon oleaginosum]TXT15437.1 hypothetical protein COLE_01630 [Cutaneotrichosporon oleaginosum]
MDDLAALLEFPGAPSLIHLHHPHHASSAIDPVLPARCRVVRLDAVEHHTSRLLYAGAISRLARALGKDADVGEVPSWDLFARGLRAAWAPPEKKRKRKTDGEQGDAQLVILVTKAERLQAVLGAEWTAMTRLAELTGLPATLVLCSQMPWEDLRPARCDAPEPVHVYLEPLRRQEVLALLLPGSAHPLYPRFLDLLLATMGSLASPPDLEYVAGALWPLYTATLPPHAEMTLLGKAYPDPENPPPPLVIDIQRLTSLKAQLVFALAAAGESLLPRHVGRAEFAGALAPVDAHGDLRPVAQRVLPPPQPLDLPLAAKYLLVAAFCASYNPATSDIRLFGRGTGPDGRRRRGGRTRRAGYGRTRVGKVPQRLLGPKPFPLDRLLAMFSSLYAEHAPRPAELEISFGYDAYQTVAETERRRDEEIELDERWEDEVDHLAHSTRLWSLIPELEGQGLLRRTSPADRLDNVTLRCELDYDGARDIARELRFTLDDYLYELTT